MRIADTCFDKMFTQPHWHCVAIVPLLLGSVGVAQVQVTGLAPTASVSFPNTSIGSSAAVQTVALVTQAAETITSIQVPASLGGKQEFTVGKIIGCVVDGATVNAQGTVCMVPITFTPAYPGPRNLPLQVVTGNGNSDIGLSGTGVGPLAAMAPGFTTILGSGYDNSSDGLNHGVAVDGVGNAYIALANRNIIVRVDATTAAITTVAGTGTPFYNGDGIPAAQAELWNPSGVAVDAAGDVFIADTGSNKIRMITAATGLISTVAGGANGPYLAPGFSGDGGPAYYAFVNAPGQVALDEAGNLFIADTGNNAIRRIDAVSGNISSVAGMGAAPPGYTGDGGPATAATLNAPAGIAIDPAGDLFIADTGNNVIRRVDGGTGKISTIAGNGTAGFGGDGGVATQALLSGPVGLALDAAGNLYLADENNYRLRKIEAATGKIVTVAGNGLVPGVTTNLGGATGGATDFAIGYVTGVAPDPAGNLYFSVSDAFNADNFKVTANAAVITYPTVTLVSSPDISDNPLSFLLSDAGNAPLTLSSPGSGTNPSVPAGWLVDSASPCQPLQPSAPANAIAAGGSCSFALDFDPTSTGVSKGTVNVADNSLNVAATQTVSLSGTSANAAATTSTLSFSYVTNYPPGFVPVSPYLDYDCTDTLTLMVTHTAAGVTGAINGTVTFYDNGTAMPNGQNLAVTNGTASFTFQHVVPVGTNAFTAVFTPGSGSSLSSSMAPALTETVAQGTPAISITADDHIYDGNPHGITVTTVPANLPVAILYENLATGIQVSTPPTAPGKYYVTININTTDYAAFLSLNTYIYSLPATVSLTKLQAAYDGNPHAPTATTAPANLTVTLSYKFQNGGYTTTTPSAVGRYQVVATIVDPVYGGYGLGTLEIYSNTLATTPWIVNQDSTVSHLSSAGAVLTTTGSPSGISSYGSIAIDAGGNAWSVTNANNSVVEVSPTGALTGSFAVGGVSAPVSLAIDGAGQVWVATGNNSVTVLTNAGVAVSPATGYLAATPNFPTALASPSSIAVDLTGSIWITNGANSTVTRILGAASPVVTPTVLGVSSSTQGSLP